MCKSFLSKFIYLRSFIFNRFCFSIILRSFCYENNLPPYWSHLTNVNTYITVSNCLYWLRHDMSGLHTVVFCFTSRFLMTLLFFLGFLVTLCYGQSLPPKILNMLNELKRTWVVATLWCDGRDKKRLSLNLKWFAWQCINSTCTVLIHWHHAYKSFNKTWNHLTKCEIIQLNTKSFIYNITALNL